MLFILGHLLKPRWPPSILRCEHDTSSTISLTDSNFEILSYVIKKKNDIDIGLKLSI